MYGIYTFCTPMGDYFYQRNCHMEDDLKAIKANFYEDGGLDHVKNVITYGHLIDYG